ncbi:hypothetical protein K438DRAFT_1987754 [Mycena galopus ATCC 62051]|nr:hypothetical protein K438DRAFT_1987754 [Mycena galopus ATCC 62051]
MACPNSSRRRRTRQVETLEDIYSLTCILCIYEVERPHIQNYCPHPHRVRALSPRTAVTRAWKYRDREAEDDTAFRLYELDGGEEVALYQRYYDLPLGNIWAARKVTPPNENDPAAETKWILDEVKGVNDTCAHALSFLNTVFPVVPYMQVRNALPPVGSPFSHQPVRSLSSTHPLFNPNPDPRLAPPHPRAPLPPQKQAQNNTTLTAPFTAALKPFQETQMRINDVGPDDWVGFSTSLGSGSGTTEWDGWEKDKTYGRLCLTRFLEEHMWKWLLEERVKGACLRPSAYVLLLTPPTAFSLL